MTTKQRIFLLTGLLFWAWTGLCYAQLQIDTGSPFLNANSSKRISMDLQNAPLTQVLKIFSQQSNLNLITSQQLAQKNVTVYLDNVPIAQALQQILRANNLTYEIQPNSDIYIVKPLSQPPEELVTRVYYLQHATVSTSPLMRTLNISSDTNSSSSTGSSDLSSGSMSGSSGGGGSGNGAAPSGIVDAVKNILTSKGKVVQDARTNSLIITDIASNFPQIERTINRLDVATPEILIEVEMLEVTKNVADTVGIKWGDTPLSLTGAVRNTLYPFAGGHFDSASSDTSSTSTSSTGLGNEYTVGTIDASGLTAILQFLRSQTSTKSLARPRILTLSNEMAQIKISTDEAIGAMTTTTSVGGATGQTTAEAERVQTGVFLTVTPQADVRTNEITMAIVPQVTIARTGGTFNGTTFKDPETRGTQSILRVKSGDTIVIGGLMRTEDSDTETKVPILGDIPFLGKAFRHKNKSHDQKELIVFITPTIVNDGNMGPAAKAAMNTEKTNALIREQDVPVTRLEEINKEMNIFDPKAM